MPRRRPQFVPYTKQECRTAEELLAYSRDQLRRLRRDLPADLHPAVANLLMPGFFECTFRDRKTGEVLDRKFAPNGWTNAGLEHMLGVEFDAVAQITSWYLGLINDGPTLAAGDTAASHAGWTEITDYDEATRPQWSPTASSGSISNGADVTFTINATVTIAGLFLISSNTKGGATGTLSSTAAFTGGDQARTAAQTLDVRYTKTITP